MHRAPRPPVHFSQARASRSREGAVMLIVLLILMVATASAAVSVSTTQMELQGAGNDRLATQSRYVADAAMASSIAWIYKVGGALPLTTTQLDAPDSCTEPEIIPNGDLRARLTMDVELNQQSAANEVAPLNNAETYVAAGSGGSGGSGGAGGSGGSAAPPSTSDTLGAFGPRQGNGIPTGGYVADLTDCMPISGALLPGTNLSASAGHAKSGHKPYACVLTTYGRLAPLGGSLGTKTWTISGKDVCTVQNHWSSVHNARAQVIIYPGT